MKQYWTPLARLLGMAPAADAAPADPPRDAARDVPSHGRPDATRAPHAGSFWPQLHDCLRAHAEREWVPRSQRHAEVSPGEVLAIDALEIRAVDPVLDTQLQQWRQEGDTMSLVGWLVRGPWASPAITHWVCFDALDSLTVLPRAAASAQASAYDVTAPAADTPALEVTARTRWIPRPVRPESPVSLPPVELMLHDARGERRLHLVQSLVILGAEKAIRGPDGELLQLRDQTPLEWEGRTAWFVALAARHVSGLHLLLRVHESGVEVQDLGSTNGTWAQGRPLEPGERRAVGHVDTFHLGGPPGDPPSESAQLRLRVGSAGAAVAGNHTPLRPASSPPAPSQYPSPASAQVGALPGAGIQLRWLTDNQGGGPGAARPVVLIGSLPFVIGRDAACQAVVPALHTLVSRQHLVIESVDLSGGRVLVRDASRQGLTTCAVGFAAPVTQGAWIPLGAALTLGQAQGLPGIKFVIERAEK